MTPGSRKEIEALGALRAEFGNAVRVIGLLNGDLAERLPAAEQAGVAWPQLPIEGPKPYGSPLGVGRMPCYFVLDADLTIVGVVGSAKAAALRLRQLAG